MNKSFQVALGGVMAALSLAIMLLTGFTNRNLRMPCPCGNPFNRRCD